MTDELEREAEKCAKRLLALGDWVSCDLRVHTDVAARMLGRKTGTLENWRSQLHPLPYVGGHRVSYRLVDLLAFINRGVAELD
jgi:hypothetical protein